MGKPSPSPITSVLADDLPPVLLFSLTVLESGWLEFAGCAGRSLYRRKSLRFETFQDAAMPHQTRDNCNETMDYDKIGGGLVNLVLGALILWVGQTTFRHAGMLASIDQKYTAVETHHDNLRARLDGHITQLNERTRSRFTREDGDKLRQQVDEVTMLVDALERRMLDRVTALQLKVIALETQRRDHGEMAKVNIELAKLRSQLGATSTANWRAQAYHQAPVDVANAQPTYLPATHVRR